MSKQFSQLTAVALATVAAVAEARDALRTTERDAFDAAGQVVKALKLQPSHKAALVNPDGSVSIYSLSYYEDNYRVETVPGDFYLPTEPEPVPVPEPEPETDPDLDDGVEPEPTPEPEPEDEVLAFVTGPVS